MKTAQRADYWRAIEKAPHRPVQINKFNYRGLVGLVDGTISFSSPITALCGLSGAGKSALLRGLWAVLDWGSASKRPDVINRLTGAELEVIVSIDDVDACQAIHIDTSDVESDFPRPIEVTHFEPSTLAASLQHKLGELKSLPELLDAYEPIELSSEEVAILSFIAKKPYQSVESFEIDEFEEDQVLPFVRINDGQFSYDSRTMSLGEISIMFCFWTLRRASLGTIFLAEEPETFISPSSQAALMDYLAMSCVKKNLFMVLTTHSPQMVASLKQNQILFFFNPPTGASRLAPIDQYSRMRGIVGLETPIDLLLAVEDRAARVFVSLLIARIDHALSVQVEVIDLGGDGNITNLRKAFPARLKSVTLVGAYDGDMREKMGSAAQGPPFIFLPGHVSIEESFKQLSQTHTRVFAEKLGHSVDALELALTAVNGRNPHDWLEDLAATLHRTYDQLMMAAFECWYSLEGNQQEARGFVSELRKAAQKPLIEQAT